MLASMHKIAAFLALATISTFFLSTVIVELFGSTVEIAFVKTAILYALPLLILAMMGAGITGAKLSQGSLHPLALKKKKRMPIIAANGIFILVPSAYLLYGMATEGNFGGLFYTIQGVELLFGATNIYLMVLNVKEGIALRGATASAHA